MKPRKRFDENPKFYDFFFYIQEKREVTLKDLVEAFSRIHGIKLKAIQARLRVLMKNGFIGIKREGGRARKYFINYPGLIEYCLTLVHNGKIDFKNKKKVIQNSPFLNRLLKSYLDWSRKHPQVDLKSIMRDFILACGLHWLRLRLNKIKLKNTEDNFFLFSCNIYMNNWIGKNAHQAAYGPLAREFKTQESR